MRFEHLSVAIDETVDITGIAQLVIFIRTCDCEFYSFEELVELVYIDDTTQAWTYLRKLSKFCKFWFE